MIFILNCWWCYESVKRNDLIFISEWMLSEMEMSWLLSKFVLFFEWMWRKFDPWIWNIFDCENFDFFLIKNLYLWFLLKFSYKSLKNSLKIFQNSIQSNQQRNSNQQTFSIFSNKTISLTQNFIHNFVLLNFSLKGFFFKKCDFHLFTFNITHSCSNVSISWP